VAEIALAVKLADVPRLLVADAVDGADEVAVGDGVRRLLQFPEAFGKPGDGRRRIKNNLRAVESENARALREVAVVTDINAVARKRRLEGRVAQIARLEVE